MKKQNKNIQTDDGGPSSAYLLGLGLGALFWFAGSIFLGLLGLGFSLITYIVSLVIHLVIWACIMLSLWKADNDIRNSHYSGWSSESETSETKKDGYNGPTPIPPGYYDYYYDANGDGKIDESELVHQIDNWNHYVEDKHSTYYD